MRRIVATFAAVAIALAFGAPAFAGDDAAMIEKGQEVYTAQKCKLCHAIAGKGNKKGALDEVGSKLTPEEIREWIVDAKGMTEKTKAERKPKMKNYDKLSAEELDALVAYMVSLKKKE
jgi:mono/diheme cytochrome c family protein